MSNKPKYILDTPWLKVRKEEVKFGNKTLDYYFVDQPDDVVVVPLTDKGEIIFIDTYRPGVKKRLLELPAGFIDENHEAPRHAAIQELQEETGYKAGKVKLIGKFYRSPNRSKLMGRIYLASELSEGKHKREVDEDIRLKIIKAKEAYEMIKAGKFMDAGTLIALLYLQPYFSDK